jgi:hypothetical protein
MPPLSSPPVAVRNTFGGPRRAWQLGNALAYTATHAMLVAQAPFWGEVARGSVWLTGQLVGAAVPSLGDSIVYETAVEGLSAVASPLTRAAITANSGVEATRGLWMTGHVLADWWRGAVDDENVITGDRMTLARIAHEALARRIGEVPRGAYDEARRYLEELPADATLSTERGGATELENARRTLARSEIRDLAALSWTAIQRYPGTGEERALLRHSFALALAQCVEDDGRPVCPVGQRQRLIGLLQGYYPEVHLDTVPGARALLTAHCDQLHRAHGDQPSPSALKAFQKHALEQAQAVLTSAAEKAQFARELEDFVALTYG